MTRPAEESGVARWSRERQETLRITGPAGEFVDSHPVAYPGDRPGPDILWRTGWCAYPGTEWLEEPPGHWSRAVFREQQAGRHDGM